MMVWSVAGVDASRSAEPPSLESVRQIHEMSPDLAAQGLAVVLRGVVTFRNTNVDDGMFVEDSTAGIYVRYGSDSNFSVGDDVEISGVTDAGKYAPVVHARTVRVLGRAALPAARHLSFEEMASGREDCRWGEVEGTVRSFTPGTKGRTYMEMLIDGQRMGVQVARFDMADAEKLMCARIRVQGVCRGLYNYKRQLMVPFLSTAGISNMVVVAPAPKEASVVPIASLMQFNSEGCYGRRVKVQGVVTEQKGNAVFIQESKTGLCFRSTQPGYLAPGTLLEVAGFPVVGLRSPMLEDANYRIRGKAPLPAALEVSMNELLSGDYDGLLVRVRGRLIHRIQRTDEHFLVLQGRDFIVNARLDASEADLRFKALRVDSELELTGVCLGQPLDSLNQSLLSRPEAVQLLLRTSDDVALIQNPPWWTLSRLLWMLGVMGVVILAGFAWVFALDRRVRRQTAILEQKLRHEAMLEERERIAREFHDTLEQELVAISIQLDTVDAQFQSAPAVARKMLELARNMARRSLIEARRSVWDLRSFMLENSSLPVALSEVTKLMAPNAQVPITVRTSGVPRKLLLHVENNLLRIAQEALSNALKHAQAGHIEISLTYETGKVRLSVRDDGAGFESGQTMGAYGGHFGLLDMGERMKKMGGTFSVTSKPGKGTEIIVEVADDLAPAPEPVIKYQEEASAAQPINH
jgi:signal transduction histidine kinase